MEKNQTSTMKTDINSRIYSLNKGPYKKRNPPVIMQHLLNVGIRQSTLCRELGTSQTKLSHFTTGVKKIDEHTHNALFEKLQEALILADQQLEKVSDVYPAPLLIDYRKLLEEAKLYKCEVNI
jgi:hypothetical protein